MDLGRRIQKHREAAGLSLRQLADQAGVSHSSLAKLEAGKVRGLHSETLVAVAQVLNVSLDLLVYGSTSSRAMAMPRLNPSDYPFPAYTTLDGRITAVNRLLVEATGWPEAEMVGSRLELARFVYPSANVAVRERLMVTEQNHILVHKTQSAETRGGVLHLIRLGTDDEITKSVNEFRSLILGTRPPLGAALRRAQSIIRFFGMRGISIAYLDPDAGDGMRLLANELETDPALPDEQLEQLRRCKALGVPCEYLVSHLGPDGVPLGPAYPRRVLSLPFGRHVIAYGWAGDLTLANFRRLVYELSSTIHTTIEQLAGT
jgi:transcriptional regulator with XRE-family HTH domain